jgi:hypothetical protein
LLHAHINDDRNIGGGDENGGNGDNKYHSLLKCVMQLMVEFLAQLFLWQNN